MKRGIVAMFDVLGFKGIWQTESPEAVVERLRAVRDFLRERCEKATESWTKSIGRHTRFPPKPRSLVLSDTIVLAIETGLDDVPGGDRAALEGNLISLCGYVITQMLKFNTQFNPALVFRGAISVGDFILEDTFIIGPGVDDAATWMNEPDAAVVILTPGYASDVQRAAPPAMPNYTRAFMDYEVPLKKSASMAMRVLNPLNECPTPQERHDFIDGTKRAFRRSNAPAVQAKLRNTLAFLDNARQAVG